MPLILKDTLARGDGKEVPDEALRLAEEKARAEREKAESDAKIKAGLNDKEFLAFLNKNPDGADNANNDAYLKQKMEVFVEVKKVKNEVKKFVSVESGDDSISVDGSSFLERLEKIAIEQPKDFANFSSVVSRYLQSVEDSKQLEGKYQEVARALGVTGDFNGLSDVEKKALVDRVHEKFSESRLVLEKKLEETKDGRSLASRFRRKAREDYKAGITDLNSKIDALKTGEQSLDRNALSDVLNQISSIKSGLKDNRAFNFVRAEFTKQTENRVLDALIAGDEKGVLSGVAGLKKLEKNKSAFAGGQAFELLKNDIITYSRDKLYSGSTAIFESNDLTLNVFEKGVEAMREKGLSLGLSLEDCNRQIVKAFEDKISDLESRQDQGQNRIKIILAKRVLTNLK